MYYYSRYQHIMSKTTEQAIKEPRVKVARKCETLALNLHRGQLNTR